ncbi:MAG: hypothetical protein PVJ64_03850 [Gemmatimonadales bacterium]|jgi:hypothetical protein
MIYLKSLALWLSFGVIAATLGGLRESLLTPRIGELRAHQIGTAAVCVVVAVIIVLSIPWLDPTTSQAVAIGALWVILTLVFEFGVFHYIVGEPWERLLADYNVMKGRLWPLVLVTELVVPYLTVRLAA